MNDAEYKELRDFFIRIAKGKYPEGFRRLKQGVKISQGPGKPPIHEVTYNEVVLLLFQYINIELEGRERPLKELMITRILADITGSD